MSIPWYNEKKLRDLLLAIIFIDEMPLLTIEGKGFHRLLQCLKPSSSMSSWYMLIRYCLKIHAKGKARWRRCWSTLAIWHCTRLIESSGILHNKKGYNLWWVYSYSVLCSYHQPYNFWEVEGGRCSILKVRNIMRYMKASPRGLACLRL